MTATPYLLQLADPDQSPARVLNDGADTYVVMAESSADAKAFVQNYAGKKVWSNVTPATFSEAADMTGWSLRAVVTKVSDGSITLDETVTNSGQSETTVPAVAGTGVLTSSTNYGTSDTVTIGAKTYHFVTPVGVTEGNVLIGVDEATSIQNLVAAINHSAGGGVTYVAAAQNPDVSAVAAAHTVSVTDRTPGAANNSVATTVSMTTGNGAWGHATLQNGADATVTTNKLSSLAELMVAALNATSLVSAAAFNASTHVLTVAGTSDNLGDHTLAVYVTPPNADPTSPVGVQTRTGVSVPGFVGAISDDGSAGDALTVTFPADTYGVPALIVKGRTQE